MIISVEQLKQFPEFVNEDDDILRMKLDALENFIRQYSHNNFQNRVIRFTASSNGSILNGSSTFLKVGDTIQVSESGVNDGLYILTEVDEDHVKVDRPMYSVERNLVTKVEYPSDIRMGIVNLMKWDKNYGHKVGIQSETISRHTVHYGGEGHTSKMMGYPVTLFDFLSPYMKARF